MQAYAPSTVIKSKCVEDRTHTAEATSCVLRSSFVLPFSFPAEGWKRGAIADDALQLAGTPNDLKYLRIIRLID